MSNMVACPHCETVSAPKELPAFKNIQPSLVRKMAMQEAKAQKIPNVEKGFLKSVSPLTF